jgi:hypothetical protein
LLTLAVSLSVSVNASTPGDRITLDLSKNLNPAVIEYNEYNYWSETYSEDAVAFLEFEQFYFSHSAFAAYTSYDGFTISKNADQLNQTNWIANQWGCMAGGGIRLKSNGEVWKDSEGKVLVDAGSPYLIAYWAEYTESAANHSLQTIFTEGLLEDVGVYISNHPYAYYNALVGNSFSRPLNQEGDSYKIIFHGLDEEYEDNGKTVEYTLAEYKYGQLTVSTEWKYVDLSALGAVSGIYYTMQSTDVGAYGTNSATIFCLDQLSGTVATGTSIAPVYPQNKDSQAPVLIYDLSGRYDGNDFAALPQGIYIIKQGTKVIKVVKTAGVQ